MGVGAVGELGDEWNEMKLNEMGRPGADGNWL